MSSLFVPPSPCSGSDLNDEIIIGVSGETIISLIRLLTAFDSLPIEPISRDFILEINFTNWWSDIVGMEPLLRRYMFQSDFGTL